DFLALLGRELLERLVLFAGRLTLRRGQLGPRAHLLLNTLLLGRAQVGIALGDAEPFLPAFSVYPIPVRREWRKDLTLRRRELRPCRSLRCKGTGDAGRADARRRKGGHANQGSERLSQFWNPRSRYASIGSSEVRMAASVSSISRAC